VIIAQLQMELLSCKDDRRKREINAKLDNLCRPFFSLKVDSPLASADLVILDEYSMIDSQMGQDLLSFGCPVLALGDPGQLPPSFGTPFFTGDPDVMLTDVRRQAKDNPIIQLATMTREGTPIPMGNYGNSKVVRRGGNTEEVQGADQLLVGMNKSRAIGNRTLRKLNKYPGDFPVKGEKLVCLRNNAEAGLYNGQLWYAEEDATLLDDCIAMSLIDDDGDKAAALAQIPPFLGQPPERFTELDTFDFGYALTVHKSQGSQWDKVVLLDEWYGNHRNKWLYTGITRAAEQLTIIRR
jgi:exodeoxyribonuclease-5